MLKREPELSTISIQPNRFGNGFGFDRSFLLEKVFTRVLKHMVITYQPYRCKAKELIFSNRMPNENETVRCMPRSLALLLMHTSLAFWGLNRLEAVFSVTGSPQLAPNSKYA